MNLVEVQGNPFETKGPEIKAPKLTPVEGNPFDVSRETKPKSRPLMDKIAGAAAQVGQGATFGFGDEISAGMAAPIVAAGKTLKGYPTGLGEAYHESLDESRRLQNTFSQEHPVASGALQVGGALMNPANKALMGSTIKEALTIPGLIKNAATGAASGGLYGVGEADKDRGQAALKGMEVGGALGAVSPAVLKAVKGAYGADYKGVSSLADTASNAFRVNTHSVVSKELASQGIDASIATTSPYAAQNLVRGYLSNTFFGGMPIKASATRLKGQAENAFDAQLEKVGSTLDAAGAGEKIHAGLDAAKRGFTSASSKLYDMADKLINPGYVPLTLKVDNLKKAMNSTNDLLEGLSLQKTLKNPETAKLSDEILAGFEEAKQKGRLNYNTVKAARTAIGQMIDETPFADPTQKVWRRAYGALSKDMEEAAKAAGPAAHAAMKEANDFYRQGRNEMGKLFARYGSKVDAESVFKSVSNADTLRNAPYRVVRLMNNLPASARKTVGATVIKKMGQKVDGGPFDIMQWGTKWGGVSDKAKEALAGSKSSADELDKLHRNLMRIKPVVSAVPETGVQTAGRGSDVAAAASVLHPVMWPYAVGKVVFDAAGGWFLTHPQEIKTLNEAISKNDRGLAAGLLKRASDYALDDEHKQMMRDAADFLIRNRTGVIGVESPMRIDIPYDMNGK